MDWGIYIFNISVGYKIISVLERIQYIWIIDHNCHIIVVHKDNIYKR